MIESANGGHFLHWHRPAPPDSRRAAAALPGEDIAAEGIGRGVRPDALSIAMITAPRGTGTLDSALISLRKAGFQQVVQLFAEPGALPQDWTAAGVVVHRNPTRLGCYPNWLQAAEWLLGKTRSPFLMLCEDDGVHCRGAAKALTEGLSSLRKVGCLSLYTPLHNYVTGRHVEQGWFALRAPEPWGTVSLCFPREVLQGMVDSARRDQPEGTDRHVAAYFRDRQLHWYTHAPSLVDHIGFASTLGHSSGVSNVGVGFQLEHEASAVVTAPWWATPAPPLPMPPAASAVGTADWLQKAIEWNLARAQVRCDETSLAATSPLSGNSEQVANGRLCEATPSIVQHPKSWPCRPFPEVLAGASLAETSRPAEASSIVLPARRPRVGIVSPSWTVGGVERWWLSLCRLAEGLEFVGVAVAEASNSHLVDADLTRETVQYCPVHFAPGGVQELLPKCDVVIVWGTDPSPVFDSFDSRVLFVSHGMGEWTRQKAEAWIPRANALAAVSRSALIPIPDDARDRVTIIHNGIDFERIAPRRGRAEIRSEWELPPDTLAVGYCGRYSTEKNPAAAARAVSQLPHATAVYQCPSLSRPFARSDVSSITNRCRFLEGPVADFYTGVDCLVMASAQEGFALAITEAWAAGIPVVATNVGAIDEMESIHGQLVVRVAHNASDWDLAVAVRTAVSKAYRPMVERAKALAWSHFSSSRMAKDWERLIIEMVSDRPRSCPDLVHRPLRFSSGAHVGNAEGQ